MSQMGIAIVAQYLVPYHSMTNVLSANHVRVVATVLKRRIKRRPPRVWVILWLATEKIDPTADTSVDSFRFVIQILPTKWRFCSSFSGAKVLLWIQPFCPFFIGHQFRILCPFWVSSVCFRLEEKLWCMQIVLLALEISCLNGNYFCPT